MSVVGPPQRPMDPFHENPARSASPLPIARTNFREGHSLLRPSRHTYSTGMRDSTRRSDEVFDRLVESGVGVINATPGSELERYVEQSELYIARSHQVAREPLQVIHPPLFTLGRSRTEDCVETENRQVPDATVLFGSVSVEHETVCRYIDHVDQSCDGNNNEPPRPFLCPIGLRAMRKPTLAADGHTYDYDSIVAALVQRPGISPTTNSAMRHRELMPNFALKSLMEWWARNHSEIGLTHALSELTVRLKGEGKV